MIFLIKLFYITKNPKQKLKYIENEKSFYEIKAFLVICKELSLKQAKQILLEGESPTLREIGKRNRISKNGSPGERKTLIHVFEDASKNSLQLSAFLKGDIYDPF